MMDENNCICPVQELLEKNKLEEAFKMLNAYLEAIGFSTDLSPHFARISSQYFRAEEAYHLGSISWEQYDTANSKIVEKAILLTQEICKIIIKNKKDNGIWGWTKTFIKKLILRDKTITFLPPIKHSTDAIDRRDYEIIEVRFKELAEEIAHLQPRRLL